MPYFRRGISSNVGIIPVFGAWDRHALLKRHPFFSYSRALEKGNFINIFKIDNIHKVNSNALIIDGASPVIVEKPE